MKPHKRILDVTSTVQVAEDKQIKMSIATNATAHVMGMLTDLYKDPEMAVLREYSTNGDDAHMEANVSLPIEVTLPTNLSPYLKIRDYGKGLNFEDIREIYSQYGASTKRDTNDQVGSLGLGCKSALAYTDQFTLQGIKDGIATQVAISRDEDGAGSMTIVAEYPTDEASGVEITIPSKANNDFEGKAQYLFQFWPEGRVLVNGEEPTRIEGIELEPGLLVVPTDKLDHSVIVMGNVPYPFRNDDQQHFSVVANVAMGAVAFTPSREELQMTTFTKNVVADIGTKIANLKETAAQRIVDEAKSKPEALVAALYASRLFHYKGDLTFNGKSIPTEIRTQEKENDFLVYKQNTYYRQRSVSAEDRIPTSIFPRTIFFTGFTNKGLNPAQREKISLYLSEKRIDTSNIQQYVMLNELRCSTWVEKERIIDWEEIKATKLPKQTQSGRPVGAYDVIKPGDKYSEVMEAADMEGAKHIFWYPHNLQLEARIRDLLQAEHPDCYLVMLKENRVAKFERMFPQAKRTSEGAREASQAWFDKLTKKQRLFLSVRKMDDHTYFAQLDEKKLDDPQLQLIVRVAKQTNKTLQEEARRFTQLYKGEVEEIDTEAYPLLSLRDLRYMHDDKEKALYLNHLYLYLNAVYAASQVATQTPTTDDDEKENS